MCARCCCSQSHLSLEFPSSSSVPLEDRLRARRAEFEQAALARIQAIADPTVVPDPSYLSGLRAALAAALDYGVAAIASPDREAEPVPVELLSQARLAARNGVSLDTVIRRYSAGYRLLSDTLLEEAAAAGIGAVELKASLAALSSRFDAVVAAVGEEYTREIDTSPQEPEQRRVQLLRRLLAGESLGASHLGYDFDAHHLAIAASGLTAESLRALSECLDRRLLLVRPNEQVAWAWLAGRRSFDSREFESLTSIDWPEGAALACGEPAWGLTGWRLSHRQAVAALAVAERSPETLVRYANVALIASALQDELLTTSLRQVYLTPLETDRDGGSAARQTLNAYFASAGNVSSAAAALGVNRRTVSSRLAAIEDRLGRPLDSAFAEIETALRLDQIGAFLSEA